MEIDPGSVREMPATERVHVTTEEDGSHYKGEVDTDGDKTGEGTYVWADGSMLVHFQFLFVFALVYVRCKRCRRASHNKSLHDTAESHLLV